MVNENELHQIHDIITDIWLFLKKYYPKNCPHFNSDEYWSDAMQDANNIWLKHDRNILCQKMITVCIKYLQKESK